MWLATERNLTLCKLLILGQLSYYIFCNNKITVILSELSLAYLALVVECSDLHVSRAE